MQRRRAKAAYSSPENVKEKETFEINRHKLVLNNNKLQENDSIDIAVLGIIAKFP